MRIVPSGKLIVGMVIRYIPKGLPRLLVFWNGVSVSLSFLFSIKRTVNNITEDITADHVLSVLFFSQLAQSLKPKVVLVVGVRDKSCRRNVRTESINGASLLS